MSPVYHPDIKQGTEEWHQVRAGKWTASTGAVIMGGLDTQGIKNLTKDIAWGRVFGKTDRGYSSASMARGHEYEPEARDSFAFAHDAVVEEMGFVSHGRIPNFGWSPDGLHAQRRRGLEIKCLEHKAWIDACLTRKVPSEYRWQVKIGCMVGALEAMDVWIYHPLAGGILIEATVTPEECDQIEARIEILERTKVAPLIEQLTAYKERMQ